MWYRLQRHDGTDCSATMVPFTPLRMVPIQRYCHNKATFPLNRFQGYAKLMRVTGNKVTFPLRPDQCLSLKKVE